MRFEKPAENADVVVGRGLRTAREVFVPAADVILGEKCLPATAPLFGHEIGMAQGGNKGFEP